MREDLWLALGVGALCGAAVGTERQWSGHADGADAHFGGLRTFTLLGLTGGASGWLWTAGLPLAAGLLLGGAALLVVVAYWAASARDIDGTTEVAALVVLAAGVIAGIGESAAASAVGAVTALLLAEKSRLHGLVRLLDDRGFLAGARFAVMAAVILPLLPDDPVALLGGMRPRQLWLVVLLFSGLSFAGYIARAIAGARQGLRLAGWLGGFVSSTSVTLTFARLSREPAAHHVGLASGVVGACTVLFPRVVLAALVLHPPLAVPLIRVLAVPFAVGVLGTVSAGRGQDQGLPAPDSENPLHLRAALQMAVLFQLVWIAVEWARREFGGAGLALFAVVSGVTDVDALTASLSLRARDDLPIAEAARAIVLGIAANTGLKLLVAAVVGQGAFRTRATAALLALFVACGAAAIW